MGHWPKQTFMGGGREGWDVKSLTVSSGETADCQIWILVSEDYTTAAWHVNFITCRFCFSSSCWENKDQLRGGDAVICGSSRLPRMLNRGQEFLHIVLIRPDSLSCMTNIPREGFFKRMQPHSQIPPMQHQQRHSDVLVPLILTNRQSNHNYYNCWI